jgi:glucan phosphoethanolaminetransferase (alkaline phosphatase superfamily)
MRFLSKIRTGGLRFPVLFLGLGLCVFVWGLRYKLSLYDLPYSVSHNIPTAKLVSKNELRETQKATMAVADAGTCAAATQLLLSLMFSVMPVKIARTSSPSAHPKLPSRTRMLESAGLHSFFFRPPPTAIRGLSWSR